MRAVLLFGALILDAILLAVAFGLGYYCGSTSIPPTMLIEVEGGVE